MCGVRADLRIKRPTRPYVVTGFEHITDSSYRGTHKLHALAGMVQRSQVLGSAFAADAHSFVVGARGWVGACAGVPLSDGSSSSIGQHVMARQLVCCQPQWHFLHAAIHTGLPPANLFHDRD